MAGWGMRRALIGVAVAGMVVVGLAVPAGAEPGRTGFRGGAPEGGAEGSGPPPANDDFSAAAPISGATGSTSGTNVDATEEPGEPNHGGPAADQPSVWFAYTAAATGWIQFDTVGSDFDTVLAAYTGTDVGALTLLDSNDDSGGTATSTVRFPVVAAETYAIAVSGFDADQGSLELTWGPLPVPANDDFADAEPITGPTGYVEGYNVSATTEPGEDDHAGAGTSQTIWYGWTAPATGDFTFDTASADFDTVLAAYTGTAVNDLTEVASNDDNGGPQSQITVTATLGQTYWIVIGGAGDEGSTVLYWTVTDVDPPANDNFADAQVITGATGDLVGTSVSATSETDEPLHSAGASGASVWYSYTPAVSGRITLDVSSTEFPNVIAVYTGTAVDDLTLVDRAVAWYPDSNRLRFQATAGTTYSIAIDGDDYGLLRSGLIVLDWSPTVPTFGDVSTQHAFFDEIEWMADNNITTGFPDGFRPAASVSRQAMAAFMYRFLGIPDDAEPPPFQIFLDVPPSSQFYDEIQIMAAIGVIGGFPNGTFRPTASVTRQAMSAFMYRLAGFPDFDAPSSETFTDVPVDSSFFYEIEWMADTGITGGFADGTYRPGLAVTRQAMSAFMQRLSLYLLTPGV